MITLATILYLGGLTILLSISIWGLITSIRDSREWDKAIHPAFKELAKEINHDEK